MSHVDEANAEQNYGFTLIKLDASTIGAYTLVAPAVRPGRAQVSTPAAVSLAPGDVLRVAVAESREGGLFAPLLNGGTVFPAVRVDQRGFISVPYAANVPVRGLDLNAASRRVRSRLEGVALEPQVFIELASEKSASVLVSGEVRQPGRMSLLDGPPTLLDAINRAGGATRQPQHIDVVLRRGNALRRIPMSDLLNGGNVSLARGDEIVLQANPRTFNAMGAVVKPGLHDFSAATMSLLEGLSIVGGLNELAADRTGVFVFRLEKGQRSPTVFQLDLTQPDAVFLAQKFALKRDDTVFVTTAPTYQWTKVIAPIAQTLTPIAIGVTAARSASLLGQ